MLVIHLCTLQWWHTSFHICKDYNFLKNKFTRNQKLSPKWGRGCGLVDRAADSGPCNPSSIPLGEKKENKRKEAMVGPLKKKKKN